ncbi:MAG: SLBB domain-containing protein [Planctomycetota bacterium]|nr:SLBB domain-containing protein [Planctomycetota bacterium]
MPCLAAGEEGAAPAAPPFRFRGGERVRLVVPKEVGESIEQLVTDDGFISLPTGGAPISIKGKTVTEAHALINELLEKQSGAKRVAAALAILDIPPRKVYVGGEVKLPQALVLPPGVSLTLGAALASAGGATPDGEISRVTVVQTGPSGKTETIIYDASRVDSKNVGPVLEPGAVITVPRGDVFILAGEVAKGAAFNRKDLSLGPGEPAWLTRVLFAGGGLKPTASRKDIRLIRTNKDGMREVLPVNLDAAIRAAEKGPAEPGAPGAKERAEADPLLQNGDIILAGSVGGVTILGKVKQPGVYPLAGDTLKLSRLIALAGGFTEFAKTSAVTVIRASAPKKPVRVDTGMITRDGDLDKDLDLEDGDLVFVSERLL